MTDKWVDIVEPMCKRLRFSSMFGANFVHNPEGAKALAIVLEDMAIKLDRAIEDKNPHSLEPEKELNDQELKPQKNIRFGVGYFVFTLLLGLIIGYEIGKAY